MGQGGALQVRKHDAVPAASDVQACCSAASPQRCAAYREMLRLDRACDCSAAGIVHRDCVHKFTGQMPPPYFSNGRSLPGTCSAESKAWAWQQMPHTQPLQRSSTGLTADAVHTASTTLFLLGLTAAAVHTAVAALFLQAGQQLPYTQPPQRSSALTTAATRAAFHALV